MRTTEDFEVFATGALPSLHRTAWMLCGNAHQAEDLVQETLARVFVKWRDRHHIETPAAYARTTLTRLFISSRRRRSSSELPVDNISDSATPAPDPTTRLALWDALNTLPKLDRAVLVLRYLEDRSVENVAADLGLTPAAVRTRSSRAAARLRQDLPRDVFQAPLA